MTDNKVQKDVQNSGFRGWRPEVPDEALNVHTARGKALGRGLAHWYQEGAHVENEQGENRYHESQFIDRG